MRPLRLSLEGFGSYRTKTEINFENIEVAAIVGENGAGKSTIFNALSYALFGVTQGSLADSVISTDERQATVEFEFEVGDSKYRVSRVRQRARATRVHVEAFVDGYWEAVTDETGTVASGDQTIEEILGANYATLSATVLLGQGDSGRFTTGAKPAERKRILSDILGLEKYEKWEFNARDRAKKFRDEAISYEGRVTELETSLESADEDENTLSSAVDNLAALVSEIEDAEINLRETEEILRTTESDMTELTVARQRLERLNVDREERRKQLDTEIQSTKTDRREAEESLNGAQQELASSRAATTRIKEWGREAEEAQIAATEFGDKAQRLLSEVVELEQRAAVLQSEAITADQDVTACLERVESLHKGGGEHCWTCGNPLSSEEVARLSEEANRSAERARQEAETKRAEASELLTKAQELRNEASQCQSEARKEQSRDEELERKIAVALAESEREGSRIAAVDRQVSAVGRIVEKLEGLVAQQGVLDAPSGEEAELMNRVSELSDKDVDLDALRAQVSSVEREVSELRKRKETVLTTKGALENRVAVHVETRKKLSDIQKKYRKARDQETVYSDLRKAFGKDGVPAMILAGVVEDLETLVNEELSRLSGGRLSVEIATQKETQKGTASETLDITVSDLSGSRSYDTFSGGERFRLDLAIRVGLSRLLSQRSGKPIRTLVIDEGWGALDPEGIRSMIELLRGLSDSFDTILTISHTDAITSAFPTLIEVVKDADKGSSVVVS